MKVDIGLLTYDRVEYLEKTVRSVIELTKRDDCDVRLIVVDNKGQNEVVSLCEKYSDQIKLDYFHEKRKGIPFARNRVVKELREDVNYLAFIDDDEIVDNNWLNSYLETLDAVKAPILTGPVIPKFLDGTKKWVIRGNFFDRERHPTGTMLESARTGNVLIDSRIFKKHEIEFDESLANTGGSDSDFFRRLFRLGESIVWCDEAKVYEYVLKSRANLRWIFRRNYRLANNAALIKLRNKALMPRVLIFAKASFRLLQYLITLPFFLVLSIFRFEYFAKSAIILARSLGNFSILLGSKFEEY